jgi:hypothetical protein
LPPGEIWPLATQVPPVVAIVAAPDPIVLKKSALFAG